MQSINELLEQFSGVVKLCPSPDIPPEVTAFIEQMATAKYSTFLTPEKEEQYHALNIANCTAAARDFEASCKASVLFNPVVFNYIKNVRTQSLDDYI